MGGLLPALVPGRGASRGLQRPVPLRLTGSLGWLFMALGIARVVYDLTPAAAVAPGVWFRRSPVRQQ